MFRVLFRERGFYADFFEWANRGNISAISLRPLPGFLIRLDSRVCVWCCVRFHKFVAAIAGLCDQRVVRVLLCGFRDFVAAIARSCDQRVSQPECCCGFHDFVAAIAGLCDQCGDSTISLWPLPDHMIRESEQRVLCCVILLWPLPDYVTSHVILECSDFHCMQIRVFYWKRVVQNFN